MNLIIRLFHWSDLSRSRAMVQEMADDLIRDRRKFEETTRKTDRALADAERVEGQALRMKFEKRLKPQSAFLPTVVPRGTLPTMFDAWEFARAKKPAELFPIRALYSEPQTA
jgi:hypothetical protein